MPRPMKFAEFMDVLLALIYEAESEHGADKYFDLEELLSQKLGDSAPKGWVDQASVELANRGLVERLSGFDMPEHAMLTGAGRLFVEEERGVIRAYHENPSQFVVVSGSGNTLAFSQHGDVRQINVALPPAWDEALAELERAIGVASDIDDDRRREFKADVVTTREQLSRREPNRRAALAMLDPMSKVASISNTALKIIEMLG